MGKVILIKGTPRGPERCIAEMVPGEEGYAVEWAVNGDSIDESYAIHRKKGGTASMFVRCIEYGKYEIDYDK